MSYDSTGNSTSDPDRPPASDEKQKKKPFVEPRVRRETDLIDGTGTTVSWKPKP
jgi:hypothetical protein